VTLAGAHHPLASTGEQLRVLDSNTGSLKPFAHSLAGDGPLRATGITVLQVNVGKLCNQTCHHCHVDAGPDRREIMTRETAEACMAALRKTEIPTVDITGGAPELNPNFRWLVEQSSLLGRHVMDRCNLTVLLLPSQTDMVDFLAAHGVEIIASLPYYLEQQTDAQRGEGVFRKSIEALQRLNARGYGQSGTNLRLNLIYNPVGAFLPPAQHAIEADYKRELERRHGIVFNSLYTITNMPISRFLEFLLRSGNYERYMEKLVSAFNPAAVPGLMCRSTLSVGWDGSLYDCDFNQMLDLRVVDGSPANIRDFDWSRLNQRQIVVGQHCYGCTAGAGSSCGGTTVPASLTAKRS
jgi:radical SAM/Cys-rich protein